MNIVLRDETLRRSKGIISFPKCVLSDDSEGIDGKKILSSTAKLVYGWLLSYAWDFLEGKLPERDQDGDFIKFDTVARLTKDMGLGPKSDHTARRALKALEQRKLIESKRVGQGDPNQFFINRLCDVYPDDPDWPKMDNQDLQPPVLPFLAIQETVKMARLELPNLANLPNLVNQELPNLAIQGDRLSEEEWREGWTKVREALRKANESVRDLPKMANQELPNLANANVRTLNVLNDERMNVHKQNALNDLNESRGQIDLDGFTPGLIARLAEISEEILSCKDSRRKKALEIRYYLVETFRDLQSEDFYMKIGYNMTWKEVMQAVEHVRSLMARKAIRKSPEKAFTDEIKRLAKDLKVKITRK